MRTRRKGRWLLKQPHLGARMCQCTFFFRSGKVTAVAHNGEAKQCQNTIMYAAGLYPIPEFDILVAGKG